MGSSLSKLGRLFGHREVRILMLGLDNAGKTTILYRLRFKQKKETWTVPTVGFNKEYVTHKGIQFNMWDVGGQEKIQQLWRHYYTGAQALIFVIDSASPERIEEARQALFGVISDPEMAGAALLIFANKQDLPGAIPARQLTDRLQLAKLKGTRQWCVVASSAKTGEGLLEGLTWLSKNLPEPTKN